MEKIKTIKQVISEHEEYAKLIRAVVMGLGNKEYIAEVNAHGIDCGFGDFIYYNDTIAFARRHQQTIIEMLERDADDLGEDVVKMVSGFGVFRKYPMDDIDKKDLYRFLAGVKCKETTIPNLMAWYAAETVCRWFEE